MNSEIRHYDGLDIIKFISATIFIFCHYQQMTGFRFNNFINFYGGIFNFAFVVELFFIISGFLNSKHINKIKNGGGGVNFINFFIPKYLNYYINISFTLISYVIMFIIKYIINNKWAGPKIKIFEFLLACLGLQRIGIVQDPGYNNPVWYVSVLTLCLIIFYILCKIAKNYNISEDYLFLLMVIIGLYIKEQKINLLFLNQSVYRGYIAFFFGTLIYKFLLWVRKFYSNFVEKNELIILLGQILIIFLLSYIVILGKEFFIVNQTLTYTIVVCPIIMSIFTSDKISKILNNNFTKFLGSITFSMYIWHSIFIRIVMHFFTIKPSALLMIFLWIVIIVYATIYHFLVESKIKLYVKDFVRKLPIMT